ncbi:MAG: maleylpyruvate isomerase N-terminal domain-containing protein, partial [Streptosporangiaceae bacterium]
MSEPTQFPDPVRPQVLPRACGSTGAVLAAIRRSDLDQPAPCASRKLRDVVNHILGGAAYFAELAEAAAVADRAEEEPDLTAGNFSGTFRREASRLAAAYSAPGVLDQGLEMPIGAMPGSVCAWIAA